VGLDQMDSLRTTAKAIELDPLSRVVRGTAARPHKPWSGFPAEYRVLRVAAFAALGFIAQTRAEDRFGATAEDSNSNELQTVVASAPDAVS
jgi:hypothetical protein